jgi:hypothetical protein
MWGQPSRATLVAACLVLALTLTTAALGRTQPEWTFDGRGVAFATSGALRIEDSRRGAAVLEAAALAPGEAVVGKVTIANQGDPGYLVLSRQRTTERPGLGGLSLGQALRLTIRNLNRDSHPLVYSGALAAMPPLNLGPLGKTGERRYRFVALLAEPGLLDNDLMGARVRFDFRWRIKPKP